MRSSVKRLIAVCVVLFLIISLSACSLFEKNLTIDAILALKTKQDVIDLLGEPKPYDNPDADPFTAFYDFVFMDNNISSLVAYEGEAIDAFYMTYYFLGMQHFELAAEMISYVPTTDDIENARIFGKQVVAAFTEKLGEPDVSISPINTTHYKWTAGDHEITVYDSIDHEDLRLISAIRIDISY